MTRLGLSLPLDLLALATASHSGEPFHLDGAQRILDIGGCTEVLRQRTQGESGSASRRGCRWGYAPLLAGQLG
jgi:hypothetical protein